MPGEVGLTEVQTRPIPPLEGPSTSVQVEQFPVDTETVTPTFQHVSDTTEVLPMANSDSVTLTPVVGFAIKGDEDLSSAQRAVLEKANGDTSGLQ